jgi:vitamin B12 transporter
MMRTALLLLALAAGATGPEGPEEEAPRFVLDPVVVTAEAVEAELHTVTASTVVITEQEIRARGLSHVADVLREVAGVNVQRAGSPGKVTTARLRGGNANQTLVLVDGAKLNSPTLGLADLSDLSVDGIERIEVVRGPMSALYGSEAIGGVIRIVTKQGRGAPEAWGSVEAGSLRSVWGRFGSSGQFGGACWSLGASRWSSQGQEFARPEGVLDHDGYDLTTLSGRLDGQLGQSLKHDLSLAIRWSDGRRDLPIETFSARVFDANSTQDDANFSLTGDWSIEAGRWRSRLTSAFTTGRNDFRDPVDPEQEGLPFAGDYSSLTRTDRQSLRWSNDVELHRTNTLSLGVEWERRAGSNQDNYAGLNFDQAYTTVSLFVADRFVSADLGRGTQLVLSGGLRWDDTDTYGSELSPKLGALLTLADGAARVRFNVAEGFRSPSINELAFPFYGNPDLDPELSRSIELGVGGRFHQRRGDLELRYFHTTYRDLIVSDPVSWLATNLAEADVDGLEAELRWLLRDGLYARASYCWQDARDDQGGELLRQPRHRGAVSLSYEEADWRLSLRGLFTGSMLGVPLDGYPDRVEAWQRLDLAGEVRLGASRRFALFGTLENLLDREYEELKGYPAPGITGRLGVRVGVGG